MRVMLLSVLVILMLGPTTYGRAESQGNQVYEDVKIKSRAKRGYSNRGTVVYNYREVDRYSDELSDDELGNINLDKDSRVREIHNRVVVSDGVETSKEKTEIGTVNVDRGGRVRSINNSVSVQGGISARGKKLGVGNVNINRGQADKINNKVKIDGQIDAQ